MVSFDWNFISQWSVLMVTSLNRLSYNYLFELANSMNTTLADIQIENRCGQPTLTSILQAWNHMLQRTQKKNKNK